MGEMADYYIDRMINRDPWYTRSRAYGPPISCKHCGSTNVFWQALHGDKFELRNTDDHQKHICPTSADGFGDCE